MSLDFVKNKTGSNFISLAIKQQRQLSYFTESKIQEEINETYLKQWVERKYITDDFFLNWVKAVFKTENFLSFFKYFRNPLASARLVNNKIKESLARVYHAEDSYFKYVVKGNEVDTPEELNAEEFTELMFNAILFRHNDIIVHDLKDINTPFRQIVSINNVVGIETDNNTITKLCYTANVAIENNYVNGYLYMDKENYIFYSKEYVVLLTVPHDLGVCPADFISAEPFSTSNNVVRKSIFSYAVEQFEEYVFLKTLQRMTEPNGAIPVVTQLNTSNKNKKDTDASNGAPMSAKEITGAKSSQFSEVLGANNDSPLQAGTRVKVPPMKDAHGNINMDVVKNFLNFFYTPIEALNYLKERVKEVENSIIATVLGDFSEEKEDAKNELQVSKSYQNKQDKLRSLSKQLSRIRNLSDYKLLALKHGANNVYVDCFFGSDFFLETTEDLYNLFKLSPNAIERKNVLVRLSQNRNKYNSQKSEREKILYNLMPYISDLDFDKADKRQLVDDITFQYQTRFSYWVGIFESMYGDIVYFWNLIEGEESQKIFAINELILTIIKEDYEQSKKYRTPESVQA